MLLLAIVVFNSFLMELDAASDLTTSERLVKNDDILDWPAVKV